MKKIFILSLFLLLNSCSQKQKSKNHFKFTLGSMALTTNSSAFINAIELTNQRPNIIQLDSTNSANINLGTYQLLIITFAGPELKSGEMHCGSLDNAVINSAETTFNITVSKAECAQPKYASTILELKIGVSSKWDLDRFDRSFWGP